QAMATARRLGAVVSAYDVRPAAKEQVQSMGARFVELQLDTSDSEDARGYARVQDERFYNRQRALLGRVVGESDAAAIRHRPRLHRSAPRYPLSPVHGRRRRRHRRGQDRAADLAEPGPDRGGPAPFRAAVYRAARRTADLAVRTGGAQLRPVH